MTIGLRRPGEAVDLDEVAHSFEPPPDYFSRAFFDEPDTIDQIQLGRLRQRLQQAAPVPFFARLWERAGVTPADLRTLEDLWKFPAYTVEDIRESIERRPPWGDYQGVEPRDALREPMRVYMSGGTTGQSRPTFYTEWDRAVGSLLTARVLWREGIRPGSVVLNSYQYSTFNGAALMDEALYRWLNCVVIPTSSGNVTSSERQVQFAVDYGASAIITTADHLLRLVQTAEELGYDPRVDLRLTALSSAIGDASALEELFGIERYHSYGFHEVALVGVECPEHDGLHIFEDAFVVQVVDPETGERLPDGELGSMVVTELYKTGSPQIRYNTLDLSYLYPRERCRCGSWARRIGRFAGRGDNMVKLRGVNIWPEAVGAVATSVDGVGAEWFVRMAREGTRDQMVILISSPLDVARHPALVATVEERLHQKFGLRIGVEVATAEVLDELTELRTSPKPKRFRDERPAVGEERKERT
jgi:phenylacetate-CoA ligase